MASESKRLQALALLALLAAPGVHAQLSNVPNLSTVTNSKSSTATSASATTTPSSSQQSSQSSSGASTAATTAVTTPSAANTGATSIFSLSNAPTIAGASIPTLVVPYTANAPFMQKSSLPEGTVFIIVGAILGFLGACVLSWRCLIAWSINRSVKRAALASIRGSEKTSTWGGSGAGATYGSYPSKNTYYSEYAAGSSMSLDALSTAGKQLNKSHRDSETHSRHTSAVPPASLFFSPTAQAANRSSIAVDSMNRNSTFLPAGYYASPSAAQPAGGAAATTVGGSLAPYARQSMASPSPPGSAHGVATARSASSYRDSSREGLRPHEHGGNGAASRPGSFAPSGMYNHPSSSSLMVGVGAQSNLDGLAGTRAPSAYLDDLFENHGNGPRERF